MRGTPKHRPSGNQSIRASQRHLNTEQQVDRISNGKHRYQLGAEIGRGGFAVVFQAFNVETGDFVAVKRFPLTTIDDESLGSIESEIELMKKLNHPNIVKYIDTIRTESHLHIVLEYMENGSLANVIKKFGAFSESLTAIYVTQVLRGLKYLHEQGVLHRDIKGANILTTKDGQVKLADFGVAMKVTDVDANEHDVVGTPYWMAPEIIAMSTPTVACDIWSVGCTVIELLTAKPPYFDVPPMAAMFRIVQDDYPPLPEDISPPLRDFLLLCFQKEPMLRLSAAKFLEHPWLQNSSSQLYLSTDVVSSMASAAPNAAENDPSSINSIVNTIRHFQKDLAFKQSASLEVGDKEEANDRHQQPPGKLADMTGGSGNSLGGDAAGTTVEDRNSHANNGHPSSNSSNHNSKVPGGNVGSKSSVEALKSRQQGSDGKSTTVSSLTTSSQLSTNQLPKPPQINTKINNIVNANQKAAGRPSAVSVEEASDEDWDDTMDPEEAETVKIINNPMVNTQKMKKAPSITWAQGQDKDGERGRASPDGEDGENWDHGLHSEEGSPGVHPIKANVTTEGMADIRAFLGSQDREPSSGSIGGAFNPKTSGSLPSSAVKAPSQKFLGLGNRAAPVSGNNLGGGANPQSSPVAPTNLTRFQETDEDDFSNAFGDMEVMSNENPTSTIIKRIMSSRLRNNINSTAEDDANFDEFITYQFEENSLAMSVENRDMHIRRAKKIISIMEKIKPESHDEEVIELCEGLIDLFTRNAEQKDYLITFYGVLPILEMLESRTVGSEPQFVHNGSVNSARTTVTQAYVLRVVNKIIENNVRAQEQLCLLGLIPIILRIFEYVPQFDPLVSPMFTAWNTATPFTMTESMLRPQGSPHTGQMGAGLVSDNGAYNTSLSNAVVDPLVLEAARFIHQISETSNHTLLQMLIGAGGLPALVQMISFSSQMTASSNNYNTISSGASNLLSNVAGNSSAVGLASTHASIHRSHSSGTVSSSLVEEHQMTPNAEAATQLVYMGIDSVQQIFTAQSSRTRDFCRLFMKLGLLSHLSVAFRNILSVYYSKVAAQQETILKLAEEGGCSDTLTSSNTDRTDAIANEEIVECRYAYTIATLFLQFSRPDTAVAENMARSGVLKVINDTLNAVEMSTIGKALLPVAGNKPPGGGDKKPSGGMGSSLYIQIIEVLLKCIKNLCMEPSALQILEDADTIPTLINLLNGPISNLCESHVLHCMFNLCRVNRRRQEQAAVHGLIPHLQRLIVENSPHRQLALPIICELAHSSAVSREELWKNNGVVFYINLLHEKYWQTFALNALATWLANDRDRVQEVLVHSDNLCLLIDFFRSVSAQEIGTLHKPLLDLMSKSKLLCRALGCSGLFVSSLVKRLRDAETIVLRSLLKMIQLLHQHHPCPRQLVLDYNLYGIVLDFKLEEKQVLVYQIATRLLKEFQSSTLT